MMSTPKNESNKAVTSQHLLSLMDTSPAMSAGIQTQSSFWPAAHKLESSTQPVFKHGPSKTLIQRVNLLNEMLNKEIMQDDCVVMQRYLANFNNHNGFLQPTERSRFFFLLYWPKSDKLKFTLET